jgi:hypothetical protein
MAQVDMEIERLRAHGLRKIEELEKSAEAAKMDIMEAAERE